MDDDYDGFDNDTFIGTDFTSITSGYHFFHDHIVPPLLVLIGIVGLIGNGTLITMLLKTNARGTPNAFILSMAVADIMVILFYLPLAAFNSFPLGETACRISEGFNDIASGVTAFSLIALIVFCFFKRTPTSQSGWTHRTTVVAVVWALAVAFAGPTLLTARLNHKYEGEVLTVYCHSLDPILEMLLGPLKFVVYYAVPMIAFGVLYSLARLSGSLDRQTVAQRQISKLTTWLFIVYAACIFMWSMSSLLIILPVVSHEFWELMYITGVYLKLVYRCLNPIVLYCASGNYRQLFDRFLLCWCVKGNRELVPDDEINQG